MNIFLIELKAHRKPLIFWCLGMILMIIAGMGKYAAYRGAGQSINTVMESLPKSVAAILGIGNFDLTQATGFYGVLFIYLLMIATIHATMLGANMIAKEERDKTAEFLFVKPITRSNVITAKLAASFVNLVILNLVTLFSSLAMVDYYGSNNSGDVLLLMLGMFILQILFLTLGTALASIMQNPKKAASLATGILLITYLISVVVDMSTHLDFLNYFTPFKYFAASNVFSNGISVIYVLLSFVIVGIFIYLTYSQYKKRDLTI